MALTNFSDTVGSIVYDFSNKIKVSSQDDYNKYVAKNSKARDILKKAESVEWATKEFEKLGIKGVKLELKSKKGGGSSGTSTSNSDPDFLKGLRNKDNPVDPSDPSKLSRSLSYNARMANRFKPEYKKGIELEYDPSDNSLNPKEVVYAASGDEAKYRAYSKLAELADVKLQGQINQAHYQAKSYARQNRYDENKVEDEIAKLKSGGLQRDAEAAKKIAESNLGATQADIQSGILKDKDQDRQERRDKGLIGYGLDKVSKNVGAYNSKVGGLIGGATDAILFTAGAIKEADQRLWKPEASKKGDKYREKAKNPAEITKIIGGEHLKNKKARYLEKAAEADETARAKRRAESFKTGSNVLGAVKDSLSSKSRARTLAERGTAGVKRRDAQIAYALGDHSFFTKLAAGKSFGSRNAFTRTLGKLPGYLTYGRKEAKARKNYATQLSYGGFSEGQKLALSVIHNFSEDDPLMEQTTGEGWQFREYPDLAKIVDDDKYEKLDAQLIEKGEFSENDLDMGQTPPDGRVIDSDSLRPGREEVTVENILNKNYYQASPLEKKFQEMLARGFSESDTNPYEEFLQAFSDSADSVRGSI